MIKFVTPEVNVTWETDRKPTIQDITELLHCTVIEITGPANKRWQVIYSPAASLIGSIINDEASYICTFPIYGNAIFLFGESKLPDEVLTYPSVDFN